MIKHNILVTDVMLGNILCDSIDEEDFDSITSLTFVDAHTGKREVIEDVDYIKYLKDDLLDRPVWDEIEIELRKCVDFIEFVPVKDQPKCLDERVHEESYDCIGYWNYDDFKEEFKSGKAKAHFGAYSMLCHKPSYLSIDETNFTVYKPLSTAIEYGLLKADSDSLSIPILRDGVCWVRKSPKVVEKERYKEGYYYKRDDFNFVRKRDHEFNTVLGTMNYKITDRGKFARLMFSFSGQYDNLIIA